MKRTAIILTITVLAIFAAAEMSRISAVNGDLAGNTMRQIEPERNSSQSSPSTPGVKCVTNAGVNGNVRGESSNCESIVAFRLRASGFEDILVMNPDGTNKVGLLPEDVSGRWPQVSPDGTKIVFASPTSDPGLWNLFVMRSDGSERLQLTSQGLDSGIVSFHPDSSRIAFKRLVSGPGSHGPSNIFTINLDGTGLTQLTSGVSDYNSYPVYSPDGSKIAFERIVGGTEALYLMNADGTSLTLLASSPEIISYQPVAFTPDSSQIIFLSNGFGGPDIWFLEKMSISGTSRISLTPLVRPSPFSRLKPRWYQGRNLGRYGTGRGLQDLVGEHRRHGFYNSSG